MIKNKKIERTIEIITLLGIIFMIVAFVINAQFREVNADAAYYLGIVESFYKGEIPYKDLALAYTPLSFYLMLIPRFLSGNPISFFPYLLFLHIVSFLNAFLLSVIVYRTFQNRFYALLSSFLFLIYTYYLEGIYLVLEPFVLLFGLLGLLFLLSDTIKSKYLILSGCSFAFAFLAKQYGLVFLAIGGFYLIIKNTKLKDKIKSVVLLSMSFFIIIAFCVVLAYILRLSPYLNKIGGQNYGIRTATIFVDGWKQLIKMFPILLILPFIIFQKIKSSKKYNTLIITSLIGIILFSFQFIFNVFLHYYLLILPFVILIIILSLHIVVKLEYKIIILLFIGFQLFQPLKFTYKNTRHLYVHQPIEKQIKESDMINNLLDDYDIQTVYCLGSALPLYFLNQFEPPLKDIYGYSFGFESEDNLKDRIMSSDCIIVGINAYEGMNLSNYINNTEFKELNQIENKYIFVRN